MRVGGLNSTGRWRSLLPALMALWLSQAQALTAIDRTFDELVGLSELVLVGTVSDIRSDWGTGAGQRHIFSYITLSDLEVLKGDVPDPHYVLRMSGGVVDRFAESYPGVPQFERGGRYVVFIRGNYRDMFPLVGVAQGFFQVKWDEQRRIIVNDRGQAVVGITPGGRVVTETTGRALTGGLGLDDFLRLIRARLPASPLQNGAGPRSRDGSP